jgi:DNA adenine methylase
MTTAPLRPALRYYGGKFDLAPWIISHMPPHSHYVEPCFGAGNVLLCKEPVKLETVNDLNGRVVNYFRVLRNRPEELIHLLDMTPWAKEESDLSKIETEDSLEDARRFHIMCWMGYRGGPEHTGFRVVYDIKSRWNVPAEDLTKHSLWEISQRLRNVQIMKGDALALIDRYRDIEDVLIYFDPPYLPSERTNKKGYGASEVEIQFHEDAANILRELPGHVLISHYSCDVYKELYEDHGWLRVDKVSRTNSGGERTESLYMRHRTAEALKTVHQGRLL